jgi:putative ABC transport system permease protein
MCDAVWQNIRYAARSLRRTPAFTVSAIVTLAIGIGASVAVFSIVDAAVLRPLPFPDADRLTAVWERPPAGAAWTRQTVPYALFADWERDARSFEALAGMSSRDFTLNTEHGPLRITGALVTPAFFATLKIVPALGADLSDPSSPGEQNVVVSSVFWRQHLGSDPHVLDRTLILDDSRFRVVAVLPPGVRLPSLGPQPDVWLRVTNATRPPRLALVGRLRDNVTPIAAEGELATMQRARAADARGVLVRPLQGEAAVLSKPSLALLSLAVALLFLIACANVTAMLLERFFMRRRELAIRASIGATGRQIATQLIVEHLVLWACAGIAGVALATALVHAFRGSRAVAVLEGLTPELIAIDWRVLLFAALVAATGALLCAIAPAIASSRSNVTRMLRSAVSSSGVRAPARRLIVAIEVALAVALLVNADLLIASYDHMAAQPIGVRDTGYLTFRLQLPRNRYGEHSQRMKFHDELLSRLRAVPAVEGAGAASARPLGGVPVGPFEVDTAAIAGDTTPLGGIEAADPEFFGAAGIPLLAGRAFEERDQGGDGVAIVNQTLARRFFGTAAVGRRIRIGPPGNRTPWMTIVGVVGDVRHAGLNWDILPEVYLPYSLASSWNLGFITTDLHVVVRHPAGVPISAATIHDAVWAVDPALPVTEFMTFPALIAEAMASPGFRTSVVTALAAFAVLLSAVGLLGVLSFIVGRRQSEIGIRMAVGADRRAVVRLVLFDMTTLALCGIAVGIPAAWASSHVLESLLFGVSRSDLAPYIAAIVVIGLATLVAAIVPAMRAARIDPVIALRAE